MSTVLLCGGSIDRHAAVAERLSGLPKLEQRQQADEADDRAGHVRQVRSEVHGNRVLAGDVAERADHRERPRAEHALLAGNQIQQYPGRQQREHGNDRADRPGQRQQWISGDRRERDDRRTERAVRYRRVVRDRRDADCIQIGDAERNQDRRHDGPRITESDQAFEQRAERPGKQHRLHAHIEAALGDQPAAEVFKHTADIQRVEQDQSPERNPVDIPDTGGRSVEISLRADVERHLPDRNGENERENRAEQHGQPRRNTEHGEQHQQEHDRNQRNQTGQRQIVQRIDQLGEHEIGSPSNNLLLRSRHGSCLTARSRCHYVA